MSEVEGGRERERERPGCLWGHLPNSCFQHFLPTLIFQLCSTLITSIHMWVCVCVCKAVVCVCVCTDPRARRLKLCILQHGQKWKQLNLFFLLLNINPSTFSTRRSSDPKRNAVKSAASTDERHPDGLKGASQSLQRLPVTTDSQLPSRVISVCDSRVSLENKLLQRNVRIMCWSSKSEIRWQLVWITSEHGLCETCDATHRCLRSHC